MHGPGKRCKGPMECRPFRYSAKKKNGVKGDKARESRLVRVAAESGDDVGKAGARVGLPQAGG